MPAVRALRSRASVSTHAGASPTRAPLARALSPAPDRARGNFGARSILQAKCACEEATLARKASTVPSSVGEVLRSPGEPIPPQPRAFMESAFGRNFADVRVHRDARAAASARAVGARAYTVGNHVAFDRGQYAPESASGRKLLAHELAHVVQQGGRTPNDLPTTMSEPGDGLE